MKCVLLVLISSKIGERWSLCVLRLRVLIDTVLVIMTINAIGEKTWFREKWWVDVIVNTQNCVVSWIWNLDQGVGDNLLDLFGNSSSIIFK